MLRVPMFILDQERIQIRSGYADLESRGLPIALPLDLPPFWKNRGH